MVWRDKDRAARAKKYREDAEYRKHVLSLRRKTPTPAAEQAERTVETITAEVRANARASEARKDAHTLGKRIVELEDAINFMHAGPSAPPRIVTPSARPKTGIRIGDPVFNV